MSKLQLFSWKNSRILMADDEPDMREIFSAWFRNLGCFVTEVADGKEALDALARERFDIIVTDVRMPRIDGVQLVRQLHRCARYTPVVIFVSGYVDFPLPDALDPGVEAVRSKPCEKKDLIDAVRRSLLRKALIFEVPADATPPAAEKCIRQDFSRSATDSELAVGRGGISLNLRQRAIPESTIGFSLSFTQDPLTHLAGWGALRWCENVPGGSRIGIEFLYLDEQSLAQLARWLQEFAPVSFIPKDCHSHSVTSSP